MGKLDGGHCSMSREDALKAAIETMIDNYDSSKFDALEALFLMHAREVDEDA